MQKFTPETTTLKDYWENRQALFEAAVMLGVGFTLVSSFQKEAEVVKDPAPATSIQKPHETSQAQKKAPEPAPSVTL